MPHTSVNPIDTVVYLSMNMHFSAVLTLSQDEQGEQTIKPWWTAHSQAAPFQLAWISLLGKKKKKSTFVQTPQLVI